MLNGSMAARERIEIQEPRMAHIYDGVLYLARPGRNDHENYRRELRSAYGVGPRCVVVKPGTVLVRSQWKHGYDVPQGLEVLP